MTQPTPEEMDAQEASTLDFEHAAAEFVTAVWVAQVARAAARIAAAPLLQLRSTAQHVLHDLRPDMGRRLQGAIAQGAMLGVQHAAELGVPAVRAPRLHDHQLETAPLRIDADARAAVARAVDLAQTLNFRAVGDLDTLTAAAVRAGTQAQDTAGSSAQRSVYHSVAQQCLAANLKLLWRAERDACLHCLALSGMVITPGQDFPLITWADKPLPWSSPYPPRHNHCRCSVVPWTGGQPGRYDESSAASALKREAARSVVRGFSSHASVPARLRAADRALQRGVSLPKTVLARAQRDVKRGTFSGRHNARLPSLPPGKG